MNVEFDFWDYIIRIFFAVQYFNNKLNYFVLEKPEYLSRTR